MATILVPLPSQDFDPTESAVPWRILTGRGHRVVFATPDGRPGRADARMVTGVGLSVLAPILRADANARSAYNAMAENREFLTPMAYDAIDSVSADALLLAGGHAAGMRPYLESAMLQSVVARFFAEDRPVAAICHGVLLAARSRRPDGRSVLHGRRTTCLLKMQEMMAWAITCLWLGNYYRTYPTPVEDEVRAVLAKPGDFEAGPTAVRRDSLARPELGFIVRDRNYLSGRWPGDAHRLGLAFAEMLGTVAAPPRPCFKQSAAWSLASYQISRKSAGPKPHPPHSGRIDAVPVPHLFFKNLSITINAHPIRALPGRLGMWSDLLVAFLISMPALIYGAIQWLTYLQ